MRVLYVTTGFVYPLTAGQLRHYHLIRELGARHEITLASLVDPGFDRSHLRAIAPFVEHVEVFGSEDRSSLPQRMQRKLGGLVPGVAGGAPREMRAALRSLAAGDFDVLVVAGRRVAPIVRGLPVPIVADLCDAAGARILAGLRHRNVHVLSDLIEYLQSRGVERWLARRASSVVFASERDRRLVLGDRTDRAVIVPNGVDLDAWTRSMPRLGDAVVFFGNMSYPPNDDAAVHLVREVLALVRGSHPAAELHIVGTDPSDRLLAAGRAPGVTVTGYVDDVAPYLERAAVMAAPLRFASGIQNEILQALAMEVPVVASSVAAEGIRVPGADPPITIADGAAAVAAAVSAQLAAARLDPAPHRAGREYVVEHFDWSASAAVLERALVDAVAGSGAPSPR